MLWSFVVVVVVCCGWDACYLSKLGPSRCADRVEAEGQQGWSWQPSSWFCVYNTEITNTRMKLTAVLMALSVHWNHKHKDEADSSPHGSVCLTLKSQTQGWSWQQSSRLCLYNTEITNTPTNQTAVIRTLSLRWNQKHKDNSDSSHYHQLLDNSDSGHYGSICRMKLQTQAQFWYQSVWLYL